MGRKPNNKARSRKPGKNNFQDKFAEREKMKGERIGRSKFVADKGEARDLPSRFTNDPQWYFKDANILRDVASFTFVHPLGANMKFYDSENVSAGLPAITRAVPGLMYITLALTPGISVDAQSPLNLAAQDLYSFVRYKNSGASNYDPPDLMMYILAIDSLYTAWNWMKRIYGYASTYSAMNKYQPRAYAMADNVDIDNIYQNLADFRGYLNMAANRISAFAVPAVMTYNVRHSWLFSNIYKDADTYKAQEYMYVPDYFYQFSETSATTGTSLTPIPVVSASTPYTFTSLKALLDGMINALQYSEDAGIMSGDIIKAFESNLFKLSTFEPDYRVESVYSKEVLTQIENLVVMRKQLTPLTQFNITQDPNTNYIKFQPILSRGAEPLGRAKYLNFHWENPTPEDTMVASRLLYTTEPANEGNTQAVLTSVGSEFADSWGFITLSYPNATSGVGTLTKIEADFSANAVTSAELQRWLANIWIWSSFDWAPAVIPSISAGTTENPIYALAPELRDWDVYTRLDAGDVEAMNTLAILTEFNVPN